MGQTVSLHPSVHCHSSVTALGREYSMVELVWSCLLLVSWLMIPSACVVNGAATTTTMWSHHRESSGRDPRRLLDSTTDSAQGLQYQYNQTAMAEEYHNQQARVFFEVGRPVLMGEHHPCASLLVLRHSFANTINSPPAMAHYKPPDHQSHACSSSAWSRIVLRWSASCRGRQFDRISAVWLGGVELLRTCTAEPTRQGISWEVQKDVTRYASLLSRPQPLVLELGNVVDRTFTGIFHINLTLDFFSATSYDRHSHSHSRPRQPPPRGKLFKNRLHKQNSKAFQPTASAQLILPISSPSPVPGRGHWFDLRNASAVAEVPILVPKNVYRAVLEICVSFHGDDEFWYTNPPDDYLRSNNLSSQVPGNGPFREVQAFLDGQLVGAVWPFPVIYTGGIINLYWRPAVAIGAFDLPSYDFELTPFVSSLVDGEQHAISLKVKDATGIWLVDANLHLWLDQSHTQTSGRLLSYSAPDNAMDSSSHYHGLDGTFRTATSRSVSYSGNVVSSLGNFTVSADYSLSYDNFLSFRENASDQETSQSITTKAQIIAKTPAEVVYSQEVSQSFPLDLLCNQETLSDGNLTLKCDLKHGLERNSTIFSSLERSFSALRNHQQGKGEITIHGNLVTAGIASLHQQYLYQGSDGCYARKISTKNSSILYDESHSSCVAVD